MSKNSRMGNVHQTTTPKNHPQVLRLNFHRGTVALKPPRRLTEQEFYDFCAENRDLRIEQDKISQPKS